MPKQKGKRKNSSSEEEQIEDIMAWGNRKENYYQASQNQYSELSEEQEQAKKIYENQLEQLGNQNLYQLPQDQNASQLQDEEEEQPQNQLSHDYLTKQIKNMAKLGVKISMEHSSQVKTLMESYIQTYLMSIISLRQLNIPYVQYHPILNQILQMKQDINNLKGLLQTSTHHQEQEGNQESFNQNQDQIDQDEQNNQEQEEEDNQGQQLDQGLKIYEQAKMKHQQIKKQKKQEKKIERQKNQKPMFAKVKQNEGRLANEKILKNKGLIKKRKKIDRNSRVKHRRKFQKATSKRRAYGHVIRENPGRQYEGERNIKYGRIASTKLK